MGIKYLVDDGPVQNSPDMNPVWTIRKYNQYPIQAGGVQTNVEDVEGTYFAIAENVYQAPSLKDILNCHLLTISENLQRFNSTAASMPYFNPIQGYSYRPSSNLGSQRGIESARHSRANSPLPGASQVSSQGFAAQSKPQESQAGQDERALLESLTLATRFGDEYVDENPLIGEPGSFVFSSTQTHLRAQQAAKAAQGAVKSLPNARSAANSTVSSPLPDLKLSTQIRKGTKTTEKTKTPVSAKRRRSRQTGSPEG
jgi:mediator of RNA polymerase II transcription subunit 6